MLLLAEDLSRNSSRVLDQANGRPQSSAAKDLLSFFDVRYSTIHSSSCLTAPMARVPAEVSRKVASFIRGTASLG
jgi:hypothetical protein